MAKKTSKVVSKNIEQTPEPAKAETSKREDIKTFLKRKCEAYGKYKQLTPIVVKRAWDPVRCKICNSISFYVGDIAYDEEYSKKNFSVKNICHWCLNEAGIIYIMEDALTELATSESKRLVMSMLSPHMVDGTCMQCKIPDRVHVYWTKHIGLPIKLTYCADCVKKALTEEVKSPVLPFPTVSEITFQPKPTGEPSDFDQKFGPTL